MPRLIDTLDIDLLVGWPVALAHLIDAISQDERDPGSEYFRTERTIGDCLNYRSEEDRYTAFLDAVDWDVAKVVEVVKSHPCNPATL